MDNSSNKFSSAKDFFPKNKKITLTSLREAAAECKGCHLYENATQTVFSSGNKKAKLMLIGEQPGFKEDITGEPFTGPSGLYLRKKIKELNFNFEEIYFTNVVKHFKFKSSQNRKLHRSPVDCEIKACEPWLEAEIELVNPKVILCLGVTAAKTLISKTFHINKDRGKWFNFSKNNKIMIMATFHPSAILRAMNEPDEKMKSLFVRDLRQVHSAL